MTLPPKTQHEFEQWCNATYPPSLGRVNVEVLVSKTPGIPFSMQAALYQEYFRSVGIEAIAKHSCTRYRYFAKWYIIHDPRSDEYKGGFSDYPTALLAALTAAAELREGQLEKAL